MHFVQQGFWMRGTTSYLQPRWILPAVAMKSKGATTGTTHGYFGQEFAPLRLSGGKYSRFKFWKIWHDTIIYFLRYFMICFMDPNLWLKTDEGCFVDEKTFAGPSWRHMSSRAQSCKNPAACGRILWTQPVISRMDFCSQVMSKMEKNWWHAVQTAWHGYLWTKLPLVKWCRVLGFSLLAWKGLFLPRKSTCWIFIGLAAYLCTSISVYFCFWVWGEKKRSFGFFQVSRGTCPLLSSMYHIWAKL